MVEFGKKMRVGIFAGIFIFSLAGAAIAQHGHGQMHQMTPAKSAPAKTGTEQSASVDGFKITLEVMDMSAHMSMPGMKGMSMNDADHSKTHVLMVTVQDSASKEIITDAKVQYSLEGPSGMKEAGKLEWSGDRYNAAFSPKEKGSYRIHVVVESGGMERQANFTPKI